MAATQKLSVATTWINTFKACDMGSLDYCNDVANGFGGMMEKTGHKWVIKHEQEKANPAHWVYKNAGPDKGSNFCRAKGTASDNDAAPGRGVDTVDFAIISSHGGKFADVIRVGDKLVTKKFVTVGFNRDPCRLCSHKTRFGDGKLKWLILDSCYSLQIDQDNGWTPDAIWRQSFHGLHTIFGFTGKCTDSWWVNDRGAKFAFSIIAFESELADAWIASAYAHFCDDVPVAAAAGRNRKDGHNRLDNECIPSSFDSIPNKEVKIIVWTTRR
jgi:hypothetical protein